MTPKAPSVPEWLRNRNVLVTGATGFMGKVLVSKLLTSCPDLGNVFLLIRAKRGVDPQARLQAIVQQEPFRALRENHSERLKKLLIISGDVTADDLALSPADKDQIINEVSVVFHMAANVRFDLSLKSAITMNTAGTKNILHLAKQIPRLASFVHVSTSYCQCGETVLEERHYPTSVSPETVLHAVETMPDDVLEAMTPKLLDDQPNTYAFSKALSEDLVNRCGLPAGVARPSIVIASWKEPAAGWVENMNGPTGLMIGAGKGVIRSMLCNADYLSDIIPCDMAVNAIICLAWKVAVEKPETPIFMNVTESGENPISWGYALETGRKHILANPFSAPLWYPGGGITSSKVLHWMAMIFLHIIPAYCLDALFYVTGNKPFLVKVQNRVTVGLQLLQYYTTKKWIFRNDTMKELQTELSPTDKETFFMDTKAICWDEYLLSYILGARKYCLKDDPSTLPRARQVFKYLYVADTCLRIAFAIFVGWFIYSWIVSSRTITTTMVEAN